MAFIELSVTSTANEKTQKLKPQEQTSFCNNQGQRVYFISIYGLACLT